jgi:hypothetical protein
LKREDQAIRSPRHSPDGYQRTLHFSEASQNQHDHQSNVSEHKMVDFVANKMNDEETSALHDFNGSFAPEVKVPT